MDTKVKMLLLMLEPSAVGDLNEKLEMAFNQESFKFSNHVLQVGKDNVPEPMRLKHIAELMKLVEELGAL